MLRMCGVLVAYVALAAPAWSQDPSQQLDVPVAKTAAAARTKVRTVMASQGLAMTDASGDVITATYTDGPLTIRVHAAVLATDSAHSRVLITGFATRPAAFGLPEANAQVTSKSGGKGKEAWARMQRLAQAIGPDSTTTHP
jgi:hypothetical protein